MSSLEFLFLLIFLTILYIVVFSHRWAIHNLENEIERLKEEREEGEER